MFFKQATTNKKTVFFVAKEKIENTPPQAYYSVHTTYKLCLSEKCQKCVSYLMFGGVFFSCCHNGKSKTNLTVFQQHKLSPKNSLFVKNVIKYG